MSFRFLIVDDSSIVRKSLKKTIAMAGINVNEIKEAENGLQALQQVKNSWIDLIFLDINMPVMNGIEFMQELRADDEHKTTPVIIISTEGSKERIEQLNDLGVRAYLRKPLTPELLVNTLNSILAGEKS